MGDFSTETVWVVMPDYGYEGLREPVAAFKDEEQAKAWLESVSRVPVAQSMKIAAVPLYFFAATKLLK